MAIKLGSADINKLYLGNTEIKKAYLGSTIIFDNSLSYSLVLTRLNADRIDSISIPTWSTFGDIDFEITYNFQDISAAVTPTSVFNRSMGDNDRIELFVFNGFFAWRVDSNSISLSSYNSPAILINTDIKIAFSSGKLYIDDVEVLDSSANNAVPITMGNEMVRINGINGVNDGVDVTIKPFSINSSPYGLTEGAGAVIESADTTPMTIRTDNAGGLAWINSNIWSL